MLPTVARSSAVNPGARARGASLALALLVAGLPARAPARPGERDAPVRVELRARADVPPGRVMVGEVAEVSGRDAARVERIRRLEIGPTPATGGPVRLERDRLARWLRARAGADGRRIEWAGAQRCEVRPRTQTLAGGAAAQLAVESVAAELGARGLRAEVKAVGAPGDLDVPAGPVEMRVRSPGTDAALARSLSVRVDVVARERVVATFPVRLELRVWGPALVARAAQPAGAGLDPALLERREIEWSGRTAPPLPEEALEGHRLRRPLPAGEPVTRALVEATPLVARGEQAVLRASEGSVELQRAVEVMQDGFAGQSVPVRIPGGNGMVVARVVGPGRLEMTR